MEEPSIHQQKLSVVCAQLLEAHHKLYLRLLLHFGPREFSANAPEGE